MEIMRINQDNGSSDEIDENGEFIEKRKPSKMVQKKDSQEKVKVKSFEPKNKRVYLMDKTLGKANSLVSFEYNRRP